MFCIRFPLWTWGNLFFSSFFYAGPCYPVPGVLDYPVRYCFMTEINRAVDSYHAGLCHTTTSIVLIWSEPWFDEHLLSSVFISFLLVTLVKWVLSWASGHLCPTATRPCYLELHFSWKLKIILFLCLVLPRLLKQMFLRHLCLSLAGVLNLKLQIRL